MCLEVLNGKLCFIVNLDKKDNEVWLMEEYGEGSSWTRVYKIEYDGVFKNVNVSILQCFPIMARRFSWRSATGVVLFLFGFTQKLKNTGR